MTDVNFNIHISRKEIIEVRVDDLDKSHLDLLLYIQTMSRGTVTVVEIDK